MYSLPLAAEHLNKLIIFNNDKLIGINPSLVISNPAISNDSGYTQRFSAEKVILVISNGALR